MNMYIIIFAVIVLCGIIFYISLNSKNNELDFEVPGQIHKKNRWNCITMDEGYNCIPRVSGIPVGSVHYPKLEYVCDETSDAFTCYDKNKPPKIFNEV